MSMATLRISGSIFDPQGVGLEVLCSNYRQIFTLAQILEQEYFCKTDSAELVR